MPLVLEEKLSPKGVLQKSCSQTFRKILRNISVPENIPAILLKKRFWHMHFPVNSAKCSRTLLFRAAPLTASVGTWYHLLKWILDLSVVGTNKVLIALAKTFNNQEIWNN